MNIDIMLILHAFFGFIALSSAVVSIVCEKGNIIHKYIGYIFVLSAIASATCGVFVAIEKDKLFFINIGVATIIQIVMGIRILNNKKFIASSVDSIVLFLFLINSLLFFTYEMSIPNALGGLYVFICLYQFYLFYFRKNITKMMWLSQHISHMLGAVISVITAFAVGNIGSYSSFGYLWIAPAILFIPLVRYFKLKYAPDRASKVIKW